MDHNSADDLSPQDVMEVSGDKESPDLCGEFRGNTVPPRSNLICLLVIFLVTNLASTCENNACGLAGQKDCFFLLSQQIPRQAVGRRYETDFYFVF